METRDDIILAVRRLADSPDWKALERYLLSRFGFAGRTTLGATPERTAFNEGQRVLVNHLLSLSARATSMEHGEVGYE